MTEYDDEAKKLLLQFTAEELDGDWEKLKDFDFLELKHSKVYGCPGRGFDCDDTNLARAIYALVWGGTFKDLTSHNQGRGMPYRGDTMNSFHTMFGRELKDSPGLFAGFEKYAPDDAFRERVKTFHRRYHSIGNFVVLPNLPVDNGDTINLYRGTHPAWRDYFDRFLIHLDRCFCDSPEQDPGLRQLVKKNDFFFQPFRGSGKLHRLAEICLWEDYLGDDGSPTQIFEFYFHWKKSDNHDAYFKAAKLYLEESLRIIDRRTARMIATLKLRLSQSS